MKKGRCTVNGIAIAPEPAADASMRIMSANIRRAEKFFATAKADVGTHRWRRRVKYYLHTISTVRPDIFGAQEVLPRQQKYLVEHLKEYGNVVTYRDKAEGSRSEACPIFYSEKRFDLLDSGTFWLSEHPNEAYSRSWGGKECRISTYVILKDKQTGRTLAAFNAHVEFRLDMGRNQELQVLAEQVRKIGAEKGADRLILFGDLNTDKHAEGGKKAMRPIDDLLKDAKTFAGMKDYGITFHGYGLKPGESVDYIYLQEDATVLELEKVEEKYGEIYPSDHFPIYATVIF